MPSAYPSPRTIKVVWTPLCGTCVRYRWRERVRDTVQPYRVSSGRPPHPSIISRMNIVGPRAIRYLGTFSPLPAPPHGFYLNSKSNIVLIHLCIRIARQFDRQRGLVGQKKKNGGIKERSKKRHERDPMLLGRQLEKKEAPCTEILLPLFAFTEDQLFAHLASGRLKIFCFFVSFFLN